jgi:C4-dicarboxylate transporter DctQ subunit
MVGAWNYLSKLKQINIEMEDLEIQRWMSESIIFLGFLFLIFRFLQLLIKILNSQGLVIGINLFYLIV